MTRLRVNAPVADAQVLATRVAEVELLLATNESTRQAALAATNAAADTSARPLLDELEELRAALEPWWRRNAHELTGGKRKSAELGGCMIGLATSRASVIFTHADDKAAVAAVRTAAPWAGKALLKQTFRLDRPAIAKALEGRRADEVRALGFDLSPSADAFFIKRVEQEGVAVA